MPRIIIIITIRLKIKTNTFTELTWKGKLRNPFLKRDMLDSSYLSILDVLIVLDCCTENPTPTEHNNCQLLTISPHSWFIIFLLLKWMLFELIIFVYTTAIASSPRLTFCVDSIVFSTGLGLLQKHARFIFRNPSHRHPFF